MFSKIGLGCASCEKDITNLNASKVDYLPWNALPETQRLGRQGKGFSKILQNMKPETMTRNLSMDNTLH